MQFPLLLTALASTATIAMARSLSAEPWSVSGYTDTKCGNLVYTVGDTTDHSDCTNFDTSKPILALGAEVPPGVYLDVYFNKNCEGSVYSTFTGWSCLKFDHLLFPESVKMSKIGTEEFDRSGFKSWKIRKERR
ncbi:predicted protein [Aspergillus terreus NIH2624]|uniref:Uncharacterized protein n=1 Tax=Aspergillus terreus (strain NIH 2624 / FGSC A1156) TaxID=341663 RepID=Q0D0W4_ASPTN|nr:uncharacterized protein ATEG_00420 [Aspergillus terreus NIH2624]EAU39066.1 predicted protein [Aspergillus terreus NIH2624]